MRDEGFGELRVPSPESRAPHQQSQRLFAPSHNNWVTPGGSLSRDSSPSSNSDSAVIDRHKARQLFGETMRDIGILISVFAPLDAFFQRERPGWLPLGSVVVCGLLFIAAGIMLEAKE